MGAHVKGKNNIQNTIGVKEPNKDAYSTWLRPEAGKPACIISGSCSIHRVKGPFIQGLTVLSAEKQKNEWRLKCEWDLGK